MSRMWTARPQPAPPVVPPVAGAVRVASGAATVLTLLALVIAAVVVPLLPPLGWKVKLTMAAAVLQVGGFYILARTGALRRSPFDVPALAFLAAAIAATAFSVDRLVSFFPSPLRGEGLLVYAAYVLAGLGAVRLSGWGRSILLWAMLAGGGVIGVIALGQYYGADALQWTGFRIVQPQVELADGTSLFVFDPVALGDRSIGTLGQSMFLGALALLLLPLAAAFTLQAANRAAVLLASASTVALYAGLVTSQSRAAWVAAAVSGALLVALVPKSRVLWVRLAMLLCILAAVTVGMSVTRPQAGLALRAASIVEDLHRSDQSWGQRVYIWEQTLPLIGKRPVWGWGFSTLLSRFPGYGSAEYRRRFGEERVELIDNPHNELLNVAFSMGLVGLAAYVWVWAAAFSGAVRGLRGRAGRGSLSGALLAALLAYLIWMQMGWSHIGVAGVFWVILGLAAARPSVETW